MSTFHDAVLAQAMVWEFTEPACKGRGVWWSERERDHEAASTKQAAAAAAEPALRLCKRCPDYEQCELQAQLDNYTGLAAGAAYVDGVRRDPARVRQMPTRRSRVA